MCAKGYLTPIDGQHDSDNRRIGLVEHLLRFPVIHADMGLLITADVAGMGKWVLQAELGKEKKRFNCQLDFGEEVLLSRKRFVECQTD
ncbi:MAG: hypothetical protein NHB14_01295 [Desulfosporosinus sp.]|nr:hypothetical protein [Desulfosporosinus sp.]MCO5384587.1 hypothetical protein [Desulfosporosinus sp.]MDA8220237.1 hypothetical protein [Desulfitobacterium hafniense]